MLLCLAPGRIGQMVKEPVEHGVQFSVRAARSEFTRDLEHCIVLPVERRLRPSKPFAQTQKVSKGGDRSAGQVHAISKSIADIRPIQSGSEQTNIAGSKPPRHGQSQQRTENDHCRGQHRSSESEFSQWPGAANPGPYHVQGCSMTLITFMRAMAHVPIPARNDREACIAQIKAILASTTLQQSQIALYASQIALGMDLFADTGLRPLWVWIDDRTQSRLPDNALPYDITLASALHAQQDGSLSIAIWELGLRHNRIQLLLDHTALVSPFTSSISLRELFEANAPSHALYQDLRPGPPYRYQPATTTLLSADAGPPDISAQAHFLRSHHLVGLTL